MPASDLDAIDPAVSGSEVAHARAGSGVSALLILAVCLGFAVLVSAAVSIFVLTGDAWFGSTVEAFVAWFLSGAPAA
jgi:hypothetical protein